MKTLKLDATFHAQAKLMEEYKARRYAEWDLDYEIRVWKEREAELTGGASVEQRE